MSGPPRHPPTDHGPRNHRVWSTEAILAALREWTATHGSAPRSIDVEDVANRDVLPALPTLIRRFGSWNAALVAAGYEPRPSVPPTKPRQPCEVCGRERRDLRGRRCRSCFTDDEALAKLRAFYERTGESPTSIEWRTQGFRPSVSSYVRRFGNWNKALDAAGLVPWTTNKTTLKGQKRDRHRNRNMVSGGLHRHLDGVSVHPDALR